MGPTAASRRQPVRASTGLPAPAAPAPIGKPTGNMATSFFGKARLPASLQRGLLNFQAPRAVQAAASQAPALADLSKKQLKALLQVLTGDAWVLERVGVGGC